MASGTHDLTGWRLPSKGELNKGTRVSKTPGMSGTRGQTTATTSIKKKTWPLKKPSHRSTHPSLFSITLTDYPSCQRATSISWRTTKMEEIKRLTISACSHWPTGLWENTSPLTHRGGKETVCHDGKTMQVLSFCFLFIRDQLLRHKTLSVSIFRVDFPHVHEKVQHFYKRSVFERQPSNMTQVQASTFPPN